jgi:hypothetical protein
MHLFCISAQNICKPELLHSKKGRCTIAFCPSPCLWGLTTNLCVCVCVCVCNSQHSSRYLANSVITNLFSEFDPTGYRFLDFFRINSFGYVLSHSFHIFCPWLSRICWFMPSYTCYSRWSLGIRITSNTSLSCLNLFVYSQSFLSLMSKKVSLFNPVCYTADSL